MKQTTTLVLFLLIAMLGCATFPANRSPKLARPRIAPELRDTPAIRLVVHDRTSRPEKTAKSFERARRRFPYLAPATEYTVDPDYTIQLSVDHNEFGSKINEMAAYSFFVIPAISTEEVTVRATVTDSDDGVLGTVRSVGRSKQVVQMHLLWALPLALPLSSHVDRKLWTNTFRDVFIQAAKVIAEDQRAAASAQFESLTPRGRLRGCSARWGQGTCGVSRRGLDQVLRHRRGGQSADRGCREAASDVRGFLRHRERAGGVSSGACHAALPAVLNRPRALASAASAGP